MTNALRIDPVIARDYATRVIPKLRSDIHLNPYEKVVKQTVDFAEKGITEKGVNIADLKASLNQQILRDYVEKVLPKIQSDVRLNEYERLVQQAVNSIEKGDLKALKSADELLGRYMVAKK